MTAQNRRQIAALRARFARAEQAAEGRLWLSAG